MEIPNTYISREYELRINVFPYKDQITFSCRIEDENIQIFLYNRTNLMNDSYIINNSCENNNKLSKLYYNDNKNYLIINCLNKRENEEEKKRIEEENKKTNTIYGNSK